MTMRVGALPELRRQIPVAFLDLEAAWGLFSGGRHFTEFVMRAPSSLSGSSAALETGALARPNLNSVA